MFKSTVVIGLFIGFIAILHDSCSGNNDDELYFHQKGIIVTMGGDTEETGLPARKYKIATRTALERLLEGDAYLELTTERSPYITPEWWYNHRVGDTVRFDYIRRDRCFHIRERPSDSLTIKN